MCMWIIILIMCINININEIMTNEIVIILMCNVYYVVIICVMKVMILM